MTDVRNIVALCMKYMFYFILFMILISFCINILEYFGMKFVYIESRQMFFISTMLVCISPVIWSFLFTIGYFLKRAYKASILGFALIIALVLSFLLKSAG